MIDNSDIQDILDKANIIEVVKRYVPDLKSKGSKASCCCPFHNEDTASFKVDENKGMWYCFGCHEGGNAIQFVQKIEGLGFIDAVKKIASDFNIRIEDKKQELTKEKQLAIKKKEAMLLINRKVCEFYSSLLWEDNPEANEAREYINSREWPQNYAIESSWGFAPKTGNRLFKHAKENGFSLPLMVEMGLLKENESGNLYDAYRDRLLFPIKSASNQVIGFTARLLHEKEYKALKDEGKVDYVPPKYINSKESECYKKSESIFGIEKAINLAVKKGKMYLVEGGPDVIRLQSIEAYNTIASLGGAWTENQLKQLKKYNFKLCFIPDSDPPKSGEKHGAGVKNVMQNGKLAVSLGFDVKVKEIQKSKEDEGKNDPDSYIHSLRELDAMEEVDFVLWYASKIIDPRMPITDLADIIDEIAEMVAKMPGSTNSGIIEAKLGKLYGYKKEWRKAISEAQRRAKEEQQKKRNRKVDLDTLKQYGFYEENNCYYSIGGGGDDFQWSNFIMKPLFHIEDNLMPKRLFTMENINKVEKLVEFKQSELTTIGKFIEKVEGLGNFIWLAKQEQLNKLKMYLYENTETAVEISQLGWQPKGFWAFGNGIFYNGEWIEADDFGIVRLDGIGNFYLPANSKIFRGETKLFQFERRFIHNMLNEISLRSYTDKLIEVFGTNAKVGICYLLATLFKDVVISVTKNFPILNLFGQKGSGKSEMGHSLMSFFITNNTPPNLQNSTDAALAEAVAQSANALVHLDEYKNSIDLTRREFLKGLYDGTGRTRMNMERDKKREMTAVDCGVIVSGQEMPTIDNALFSRLIYLTFNRTEFSTEAKRSFDELKEIRNLGCTHLTLEILRHRKRFEVEFASNYRNVLMDVINALEKESIDDRILRSWVIPLAAFRTLSGVIDVQFDYKEMLSITISGIIRQNSECRSNNEISQFWSAVEVMHQQGLAINNADFRICYENRIQTKVNGKTSVQEWNRNKAVLYINFKVLLSSYQRYAKNQGDKIVPENTLRNYLEVSQEYLGLKTAVRFQMPNNPYEGTQIVEKNGQRFTEKVAKNYQAYCFDYNAISDRYGINLEVLSSTDVIEEKDIETTNGELPF